MTHVFLMREWPKPLDMDSMDSVLETSLGCFRLHRVDWQESFLSADGKIAYRGARGPRGFKVDEMEQELQKLVASSRSD